MILEFSAENFLTFRKKATIDFCQNDKLITKHALLLGANATGKSSIKKALSECISLMLERTIKKDEFKKHAFSNNQNTISKYEVLLGSDEGTYFWYFLECDYIRGIIVKEILLYSMFRDKNSFKIVFTRDENGDVVFEENASNEKWNLDSAVKANLAPRQDKTILNVLLDSYLKERPYLQQLSSIIVNIKFSTMGHGTFSRHEKNNIELYQKFAQLADTSFVDFHDELLEHEIHRGNVQIPARNEATGTIRMLELAPFIVDAIRKGGFLCIDEFEFALHPILVQSIIEIFADPEFNSKNAQILLIGHSGTLMRDEKLSNYDIWICQKDMDNSTQIYNLGEYYRMYEEDKQASVKTRFNDYLEGRLFSSPAPKYILDTIKAMMRKGHSDES